MRKGDPTFYKLIEEISDLHERKNQNYADDHDPLSNLTASESFGIDPLTGVTVRMIDKWSRFQQLSKGKKDLVGESLEDTLKDLANYSLLYICLLRRKK